VQLTPEVKQAIAEEVKAQLAAQQAQAGTQGGVEGGGAAAAPTSASNDTPPPALDPAQRTFVVDSDVTVAANGQECGLTSGDVVTRLTDTPDSDNAVNASIGASKKGDCAAGSTVAVKVDDLQEMYNHFAENITNGMGELAKKQGTNGMPKAPDTAPRLRGRTTSATGYHSAKGSARPTGSRPTRRRRRSSRRLRLAEGTRPAVKAAMGSAIVQA
jgi:hypothetical protein